TGLLPLRPLLPGTWVVRSGPLLRAAGVPLRTRAVCHEGRGGAMKVLLCHNFYQQQGGEDLSFAAEAQLLESRGHEVLRFTRHNDAVAGMSRLSVACKTCWNREVHRELRELIRSHRPEVMHCTNTFPLISPSACAAARAEGVPVVQSLRNYRLMCPGALF